MALAPDTKLGPYRIVASLGAGGMGEVYRARDTRLERFVAIKILPPDLSADPVRRQRFEREAKAISSLNHPHICVLHDVGHQDGTDYLVMECVEGETLAQRLERGALPLEQALKVGMQVAGALDQAHRSGVVHRDLKPGNIMLTSTGAKLLDFGLARGIAPLAGAGDLTAAPTRQAPMTEQGTIVGTFQYMSPEQVEGKDVDGRSDIFSLGAVLYETLSGQRAFEGRSRLSVASAILEKEPAPLGTVRPATPPALDHVIRRCLAKDPEDRWQTGRDLAHELKWIESGPQSDAPQAQPAGRRLSRLWMAAALAMTSAAAAALGVLYFGRPPVEVRVTRTTIRPMRGSSFLLSDGSGFALSPDGRSLAYVASDSGGASALWVRSIASLSATPLPGTSGASYPFWSPDSRFLGFFAGAKLKKVAASGGPPMALCDASDGRGGTWNRQGTILFTPAVNSPLHRVAESGGDTEPVTTLDLARGELSHRWPQFLPDGRHFIYNAGSVFTPRENATNSIRVGSLDSKETSHLLNSHAGAAYAAGRILFLRQDTLMAQPFDVDRREFKGSAVPIADPVQEALIFAKGLFSASDDGLLAYVEGESGANRRLLWYDRSGAQVGEASGADAYGAPRISPDGKRLVFYLDANGYDIWTYDLLRGVKAPQTFGSASAQGSIYPVWAPDGRRIAYGSMRDGKHSLHLKASDGSSGEEMLVEGAERYRFPTDWSRDGRFLAYQDGKPGGWGIWILPLDGGRKPYPFHESPYSEREAVFSPDGRWLAYSSNESGEYQIYVVPFPAPGGKWQVSPGGGSSPRWRQDGREIFYLSPDNKIMMAEVRAGPAALEVGNVVPLFETRPYGVFAKFDVSADGQRFIVPFDAGEPNAGITLVVNWPADLRP